MGGETRTELSINQLLSDIGYVRNLKQSAIFDYSPTNAVKLTPQEIYQILALLQNRGTLKILDTRKEPNMLSDMVIDLNPTLSDDIMTVIYKLDTTQTVFPSTAQHGVDRCTLSFSMKETQLRMTINNRQQTTVASFHDKSEPYKILRAIFSEPQHRIMSIDILPVKKNLKNILQRNKLSYLMEYGLVEANTDSVRLASSEIVLTKSAAQELVSKFIEKYRKDTLQLLN